MFFLPAASHTEKDGTFTNTNRWLQWHNTAVHPEGDARSDLWFMYHLGKRVREKLAGSTDPADRPVLDLTWDYPAEGPHDEPSAAAVLAEINGWDSNGEPLSGYTQLAADGSTRCGCWIYSGVYADGGNQAARRKPWTEQDWIAAEWAWAWPANRRILYNRASARPDGTPWSERKKLVWWDAEESRWTGYDVPDFEPTKSPDYRPAEDAFGVDAISGIDPFIMQADGKGWLYAPALHGGRHDALDAGARSTRGTDARRLGHDRDRTQRDRGPGARHRPDGPARVQGKVIEQIWLPFHWAPTD